MCNDDHSMTIGEICDKVSALAEEINGLHIALGGRVFGGTNFEDEKRDDPNWPPIKKLMAVRLRQCLEFKSKLLYTTVRVSDYTTFEPRTNIEGVK